MFLCVLSTAESRARNLAVSILGGDSVVVYLCLSYDVASGSDITTCIKIEKPLEVIRI